MNSQGDPGGLVKAWLVLARQTQPQMFGSLWVKLCGLQHWCGLRERKEERQSSCQLNFFSSGKMHTD